MATTSRKRTPKAAAEAEPGKLIYTFAEGNAQMRSLLGGKGAGLAEMTNAGLPVPPGFTITTEACNAYYAAGKELPPGLWDDVLAHMAALEQETGKGFGDPKNPLLVSVRSGAAFSMPGMMDTVLNLGLNEHTVSGLIELTGNERFGYDAWRRFVAMFGRIVLDIPATEFDEPFDALKQQARREARHRPHRRRPARASPTSIASIVRKPDRRALPDRSVPAAGARHPGRLRLVVRQARPRLPRVQQDPARPGHRGEHRDHGLRQHGRRLGHRRRLHPRPEHRREGPLRRVPDQRPGRGRGGRRADAGQDQPDARRAAGGLRRVRGHRRAAGDATTATSRTWSSPSSAASCSCSRRARPSAPPRPR